MNNDKSKPQSVRKEDFIAQMQSFGASFSAFVAECGLPAEHVTESVAERLAVFQNVKTIISHLDNEHKNDSIYLSKFLAACLSGLFDAALSYLWDETIAAIRKRVIQYDIGYFYAHATYEEKRHKLNGAEDLIRLEDSELIHGARNIGLISELGFKHLDYIRFKRNGSSAAHPNDSHIAGAELVSWLDICVKEVISLPLTNTGSEIKDLLTRIKQKPLNPEDIKNSTTLFTQMTQQQRNSLVSGFFEQYMNMATSAQTRKNIIRLLPGVWQHVDDYTKQSFSIKYAKYQARKQMDKVNLAKQFLAVVQAPMPAPTDIQITEIGTAIRNLISAHRTYSNYHSEPVFARQLARVVEKTGVIPKQDKRRYVLGVVEAFLTNGNGVVYDAEPYYLDLISKFSEDEAMLAMLSFQFEHIASHLQFDLCRKKYLQLLALIKPKFTSASQLALVSQIEKLGGSPDLMKQDTSLEANVDILWQQVKY
jgi:hypothetical protein